MWDPEVESPADYIIDEAAHKARWHIESCMTNLIITFFVGVLLLALIGFTVWKGWDMYQEKKGDWTPTSTHIGPSSTQPDKPSPVEEITWDGNSTLRCVGDKHMVVRGARAKLKGRAISAGGDCQLELHDCDVEADTALYAGGSAKITMHGGSLKGSKNAVQAGGNAVITLKGVSTKGKIKKMGRATINKE